MARRKGERINGAIFDYNHITTLSDIDCHVLLVSSRTLYLLQNIALEEPGYYGRYITAQYDGQDVETVDKGDPETVTIDRVAEQFRLEVIPVCDELFTILNDIKIQLTTIAQTPNCGCETVGTVVPEEPITENPPIGPGTDFENEGEYNLYKCLAAESIVYGMVSLQQLYLDRFPFGWAGVAIAVMSGVFQFILTATKMNGLIAGLGLLSDLIASVITLGTDDVTAVRDAIEANYDQLKCRLYCATSTADAITGWQEIIDDNAALTAEQTDYMDLFLQPIVFNRLFAYRPDELFVGLAADCSECGCDAGACSFQFSVVGSPPLTLGSGSFRYDGLSFVLSSVEFSPGIHTMSFGVMELCTVCDPPINWCVEFLATDITTGLSANWTREIFCVQTGCAGFLESDYSDQFPPLNETFSCAAAQFSNPTPFSITMRILGQLPPCAGSPLTSGC